MVFQIVLTLWSPFLGDKFPLWLAPGFCLLLLPAWLSWKMSSFFWFIVSIVLTSTGGVRGLFRVIFIPSGIVTYSLSVKWNWNRIPGRLMGSYTSIGLNTLQTAHHRMEAIEGVNKIHSILWLNQLQLMTKFTLWYTPTVLSTGELDPFSLLTSALSMSHQHCLDIQFWDIAFSLATNPFLCLKLIFPIHFKDPHLFQLSLFKHT